MTIGTYNSTICFTGIFIILLSKYRISQCRWKRKKSQKDNANKKPNFYFVKLHFLIWRSLLFPFRGGRYILAQRAQGNIPITGLTDLRIFRAKRYPKGEVHLGSAWPWRLAEGAELCLLVCRSISLVQKYKKFSSHNFDLTESYNEICQQILKKYWSNPARVLVGFSRRSFL